MTKCAGGKLSYPSITTPVQTTRYPNHREENSRLPPTSDPETRVHDIFERLKV